MKNTCKKIITDIYPIYMVIDKDSIKLLDFLFGNNLNGEAPKPLKLDIKKVEIGDFIIKDGRSLAVISKELTNKSYPNMNIAFNYKHDEKNYKIIEMPKEENNDFDYEYFVFNTKEQSRLFIGLYPGEEIDPTDVIIVDRDLEYEIINAYTFANNYKIKP